MVLFLACFAIAITRSESFFAKGRAARCSLAATSVLAAGLGIGAATWYEMNELSETINKIEYRINEYKQIIMVDECSDKYTSVNIDDLQRQSASAIDIVKYAIIMNFIIIVMAVNLVLTAVICSICCLFDRD